MTLEVKGPARRSPRPVGWQKIINPKLTRRGFLAGSSALPVAADVSFADAAPSMDLELDLSGDGTTLTVREFPHPVRGQKPDPGLQWKWKVAAAAFGPRARFDLAVEAQDERRRHLR